MAWNTKQKEENWHKNASEIRDFFLNADEPIDNFL